MPLYPYQNLSGTYASLTEVRARDISALSYGLSTAGTDVANQTALTAANTAAAAAGARLALPSGTFNITGSSPFISLNTHGRVIEGAGREATTFQVTATTGTAITAGDSAFNRGSVLRGFKLLGPASGTGVGIHVGPSYVCSEPRLDGVHVEGFYDGIKTGWTDGLTMIGVRSAVNTHDQCVLGEVGGSGATNYTSIISSAFGYTLAATPPAGGAAVRIGNVDGLSCMACEFGNTDYGLIFDAVSGPTTCVFNACRFEGIKTLDVQGDATGGGVAGVLFQACMFLVTSAWPRSTCVNLLGVDRWRFVECSFSGLTSGGRGVNVQSGLTSRVTVENGAVNSGAHIVTDPSSVNFDDKRIVVNGDYTNMIQTPYGLTFAVPVQSITAAGTYALSNMPRQLKVTSVTATVDTAIAGNASNYWTIDLQRWTNGATLGTVASMTTASSGFTARKRVVLTNGAQLTSTASDTFVLVLTPTGSPTALDNLMFTVAYQPA